MKCRVVSKEDNSQIRDFISQGLHIPAGVNKGSAMNNLDSEGKPNYINL